MHVSERCKKSLKPLGKIQNLTIFHPKLTLKTEELETNYLKKLLESGHAQIWVPCRPSLRQLLLALILGTAE